MLVRPKWILLFACVGVMSGCASGGLRSAPGTRFAVQVSRAPLYKKGPAQALGPDLYLERGQRVTVAGTELGYSRVVTDDGVEGYIAARQLRPAPEPAIALAAARSIGAGGQGSGLLLPSVEPELPGLDLSDLPPSSDDPRLPEAHSGAHAAHAAGSSTVHFR